MHSGLFKAFSVLLLCSLLLPVLPPPGEGGPRAA